MSAVEGSKRLSWALRHGALKLGLAIDASGWVCIADLLKTKEFNMFDYKHLEVIVSSDNKGRFSISQDQKFIRANQGHSAKVAEVLDDETMLKQLTEPCVALHGTYRKVFEEHIKIEGLKPMGRKHVHFASSEHARSGVRKDVQVLIYIDMKKAMADGLIFYKSQNEVILCPTEVPPQYFARIVFFN